MKAFSIFDTVAQAFVPPFFHTNDGLAIRAFTEAVNDEKTNISKAPHDFILYQVGEFLETEGVFAPQEVPRKLIHGQECVDVERQEKVDGKELGKLKDEVANISKAVELIHAAVCDLEQAPRAAEIN